MKPEHGTFTHRGGLYDLGLLFDQTKGRRALPHFVRRLRAVKGNAVPSGEACASCKYGPENWHERRISEADLSFPVIVHIDGSILDGLHRLEKALREKATTLPGIGVTDVDLEKCFISGNRDSSI